MFADQAEMRERLEGERLTLEHVISQTDAMARATIENLQQARRELDLIEDVVLPQNQSAYESILSKYTAGQATFLDLLDAERELILARQEFHKAHRLLNQSLIRLSLITGQDTQHKEL